MFPLFERLSSLCLFKLSLTYLLTTVLSSPEHKVLRVSCCDHSLSVGVRLSVRPSVCPLSVHIFLFTLASTNINHSAPNLVQIYMTIRSWMGSIMVLIGSEHRELFALELEKMLYFTFFTL